jgi:hypothetical protein
LKSKSKSLKKELKMKKISFFIAGGIVTALILGFAGFAYAQTQTPPNPGTGYSGGMMGLFGARGNGKMSGWRGQVDGDFEGPMHEDMVAAFASKLGMTSDALEAELDSGKSMWQVAEEKNMSLEDFRSLMLETRNNALAQAVSAGTITQQQADWMNAHMNQGHGYGYGSDYAPCTGLDGNGWRGGPGGRWNTQPTPAP